MHCNHNLIELCELILWNCCELLYLQLKKKKLLRFRKPKPASCRLWAARPHETRSCNAPEHSYVVLKTQPSVTPNPENLALLEAKSTSLPFFSRHRDQQLYPLWGLHRRFWRLAFVFPTEIHWNRGFLKSNPLGSTLSRRWGSSSVVEIGSSMNHHASRLTLEVSWPRHSCQKWRLRLSSPVNPPSMAGMLDWTKNHGPLGLDHLGLQ